MEHYKRCWTSPKKVRGGWCNGRGGENNVRWRGEDDVGCRSCCDDARGCGNGASLTHSHTITHTFTQHHFTDAPQLHAKIIVCFVGAGALSLFGTVQKEPFKL